MSKTTFVDLNIGQRMLPLQKLVLKPKTTQRCNPIQAIFDELVLNLTEIIDMITGFSYLIGQI